MKKMIAALLCAAVLSACSFQNASSAEIGVKEGAQSQNIIMLDEGIWPVNMYTDGLPVPPGTVRWASLDTEHENCSISIADMSETEYNDYMILLQEEGFSVIQDVSEEIEGQGYVSTGSLLSDGEKGLSISYADEIFMIYISKKLPYRL